MGQSRNRKLAGTYPAQTEKVQKLELLEFRSEYDLLKAANDLLASKLEPERQ